MKLPQSTMQIEGQYQASKWLSLQALLEVSEMERLLADLGDYTIALAGHVCLSSQGIISKDAFLNVYRQYIEELKQGRLPDEVFFRPTFSSVLTRDPESLYSIPLNEDRHLIRVKRPCVQMQFHRMHYSEQDGKFRPGIFGVDGIIWGIQFSYPQIFQDNKTKQIFNVMEGNVFANTELFRSLQRWLRSNTIPTPFLAEGKLTNIPMRIGKECLQWINAHPQFVEKGLKVKI